jgi:hypothetical protein
MSDIFEIPPSGEGYPEGGIEGPSIEGQLEEIRMAKLQAEAEIRKLEGVPGKEPNIAALKELLNGMKFDEKKLRERLRRLN